MSTKCVQIAAFCAILLFSGVIFTGCRQPATPPVDGTKTAESPESPLEDTVRLELLNWDAFRTRLAGNADTVGTESRVKTDASRTYTLVDVWATTCTPCRANFHHTVALHEKYAGHGLRVFSLSLDDRSDPNIRDVALRFLKSQKAVFPNILLDEEFGVGFEKLDITAIPAIFLYDADGREIRRFTYDDPNNQFTPEQVETAVAKLFK